VEPVAPHHKVSPELYSAVLGSSGPGGAAPRGQRRRGGGGVGWIELAVLLAVPEQWRAAAQPGGDPGTVVNPRVFDESDRAASEARWARELGVGRAHARRDGAWRRVFTGAQFKSELRRQRADVVAHDARGVAPRRG